MKGLQETRDKAKKQEGKGGGERVRKKEERVGMSRERERGVKTNTRIMHKHPSSTYLSRLRITECIRAQSSKLDHFPLFDGGR